MTKRRFWASQNDEREEDSRSIRQLAETKCIFPKGSLLNFWEMGEETKNFIPNLKNKQ